MIKDAALQSSGTENEPPLLAATLFMVVHRERRIARGKATKSAWAARREEVAGSRERFVRHGEFSA